MGLFSFIRRVEEPERRRRRGDLLLPKRMPIAADREPYEELNFLHLLYLERRRSERFSRPLCLVLVEQTESSGSLATCSALRQIVDQLNGSIRETDIIGWYNRNSMLGVIFSDLNSADAAVLSLLGLKVSDAIGRALPAEVANHIRLTAHLFPKKSGVDGGGDLTFYPELSSKHDSRTTEQAIKRLIDIGGSAILLCLLGPVFAIVAAAIKLTSKGPILFRQVRIGQYGQSFNFFKFRTMHIGADEAVHKEYVTAFISRGVAPVGTAGVYKITHDPRITAVGRVLRRTSVDELPQLWNVLCGDMSLVGPRPAIPYECECYSLWHRRRIMEAKPGITGLWQVKGRSRLKFDDMVRLDLKYAQQWSIWLDIQILLQTPKAVMTGEGAY